MKKTRRMVAVALSAGLLAAALPGIGAAQDEPDPTAEVAYVAEGVDWVLGSYAVADGMLEVPEGVQATLLLNGGQAVGNAGCNSYFGTYEIDATSLTFPEPFGQTLRLCDGPEQAVEDAFLPLLQATAGWAVDNGTLTLTDADGAMTLVFSEATVEITATDVAALTAALGQLQSEIDAASEEIATLTAEFESVNVSRLRNRIRANEEAIAEIQATIERFRNRISRNEEDIARIDRTIDRFRERILTLEATAEDHEERIADLESAP